MQFPQYRRKRLAGKGSRQAVANTLLVVAFVACSLIVGIWLAFASSKQPIGKTSQNTTASHQQVGSLQEGAPHTTKRFPLTIRKPNGPPRAFTGINDIHGHPVTVACSTCHATRQPNFENKTVADLNEFHGNLAFSHGSVSCLSCHNSNDYDALKLADGTRVEFSNVMTLCAQCHGPQMRDYENGVHGGFNGHWDLTQGPQVKNNCIDCHNPHSPQFPKMQPTFKPKDRFLEKPKANH